MTATKTTMMTMIFSTDHISTLMKFGPTIFGHRLVLRCDRVSLSNINETLMSIWNINDDECVVVIVAAMSLIL